MRNLYILALFLAVSDTQASNVAVEVRIDPVGVKRRNVVCIATNRSDRPATAWSGYDGKRNILTSNYGYPIGLYPEEEQPARKIVIPPGKSVTLFTLRLDEILLQNRMAGGKFGWRWGWHGSPPRNISPISPIHPRRGVNWESYRIDSSILGADVEINGRRATSPDVPFSMERKKPLSE